MAITKEQTDIFDEGIERLHAVFALCQESVHGGEWETFWETIVEIIEGVDVLKDMAAFFIAHGPDSPLESALLMLKIKMGQHMDNKEYEMKVGEINPRATQAEFRKRHSEINWGEKE